MTVDMIFGRILKGHTQLIGVAKHGMSWGSVDEEIRYHLAHRQIANFEVGVYPPILAVLQAADASVLAGFIGRMA